MFEYRYDTIVRDACYPAVEGFCCLATGIDEVKNDFELLYGTDLTFEAALICFQKTEREFVQDVIKKYKETRRNMRGVQGLRL